MGMVYTEITLTNEKDEVLAEDGYIPKSKVRSVTVKAVADTGSMYLVITEELFEKLGLTVFDEHYANCANGQRVKCRRTSTVNIRWKNRSIALPALVIPGAQKVLFGALALEGMDLMVNPVTQEVVGVHGEYEEHYALKAG